MSENQPESLWRKPASELTDKPLEDMDQEEVVAWYLEYMKTVPDENVIMISGMPMEFEDDPGAFHDFVTITQQLKRQGAL